MREHNDPIEELLNNILGGGEDTTKKKEPPTKTEGFNSLVSEKEYEAIKNIKEAFDHFIDVHNQCVMENLDKITGDTYARIQYMFLGRIVDDIMEGISLMYSIHTCDKEFIDDITQDHEFNSIEELERRMQVIELMKKLG